MSIVKKVIKFQDKTISLTTGEIARQASGSVVVQMEETMVLVTVVANKNSDENANFFPLRVDYQEKNYAVGKIPGGFFKREGKPSERETLTARLMDRPIRPLFPKGFNNEVQIVATVLSVNPEIQPDILAMIGASAALGLSGVPFQGPMAAARVGFINNEFVLNPSMEQLEASELDLVVAGTESSVLMVESEAKELSEATMLDAVMFGHNAFQPVIQGINEFVEEARDANGHDLWEWEAPTIDSDLKEKVTNEYKTQLTNAFSITDKKERNAERQKIYAQAELDFSEDENTNLKHVKEILSDLEAEIVRKKVLDKEPRIDGRDTRTVRPIKVRTGLLPRAHGSVLFTRGETQAIVALTLGTTKDAQIIDSIHSETKDNFMLHYNFPPYSVGEIGMMTGPKRREIGHGKLAKRAISPVLPSQEEFQYVMRIVSEITESNGSSSMATVCGTSLALMDAGVPIKSAVAGIAMGLIKEGNDFAVLSDILGDEDHLGDMDFKVAGTCDGITALQMDIKIAGINETIMEKALSQAKDGRLHILGIMNTAIETHRNSVSQYAPRITSFKINPNKIRDVIGKGGATIKSITEETDTVIEIEDDGTVKVISNNQTNSDAALAMINKLTAEVEIGKTYEAKVVKITNFGAFASITETGQEGLIHISQISPERVENVEDVLEVEQMVQVKVLEVDRQGKIKLSIKEADA